MTKTMYEVREELGEEYGFYGQIFPTTEDDMNFYFIQPKANTEFKVRKSDYAMHERYVGQIGWTYQFDLFDNAEEKDWSDINA